MSSSDKPPSTGSDAKPNAVTWIALAIMCVAYLAGFIFLDNFAATRYPHSWWTASGIGAPLSVAVHAQAYRLKRYRWVGEGLATLVVLEMVVYPFVRYGLGLW